MAVVKYSRLPSQGVVYGLDKPGFIAICVSVLVGLMILIRGGFWGVLPFLPVLLFLVVCGFFKSYGESLVTHLLRELVGFTRQSVGATKYVRDTEENVLFFRKDDIKPVELVDIPGRRGRLYLYEAANGAVVVWDAKKQWVTVAAVVATPGLGAPVADKPATLSSEEREGLTFAWATVLGSWTQKPHIRRFSVNEQTRAANSMAELEFFKRNSEAANERVVAAYVEGLESAGAAAVLHETILTITFELKGEAQAMVRAADSKKAGMLAAAELEIVSTTDALLQAGFDKVAWLTPRDWGAYARSIIDPAAQESIDGRYGTGFEGVDPQAATPMFIDDSRTMVETDSGYHRCFWIGEWPRYETAPGFLSRLVFAKQHEGAAVRHCFQLVGAPIMIDKALKKVAEDKRTWSVNATMRSKAGRHDSAADNADWEAIVQHEADLVAGQGEMRFSAYLMVTAFSRQELEKNSAAILNACAATGLEPRVLPWSQAETLLNMAYPVGLGVK